MHTSGYEESHSFCFGGETGSDSCFSSIGLAGVMVGSSIFETILSTGISLVKNPAATKTIAKPIIIEIKIGFMVNESLKQRNPKENINYQ